MREKHDRTAARVWLMLLATAGGCAAGRSTRTSSYRPYQHTIVGGVGLGQYAASRTAVLVAARSGTLCEIARAAGPVPVRGTFGLAVAVDPDGYFVTAAHCVGDAATDLVAAIDWNGQRWAGPARVVGIVVPGPGRPDVAVVKIDHPFGLSTPWATDDQVRRGTPVVNVGLGLLDVPATFTDCYGCTITDVQPWSPQASTTRRVSSVGPGRPGDSGGPVFLPTGELVGITTGGDAARQQCQAVRPDPAWVAGVIARDKRRPRPTTRDLWRPLRGSAPPPSTGR
jgi:S1-C subfamily serine protease